MKLILNIDTALDHASVCLSIEDTVVNMVANKNQKDHAAWLHEAIKGLLNESGYTIKDLNAVAVSIGPGSYTGLRVGLSSAKGICYAQQIPLIAVDTLEMMAFAAKDEETDLICPVIDARRMEVFTAVYDKTLKSVIPPAAMIVDQNSFSSLLDTNRIFFFGNGSEKMRTLISNKNAVWGDVWGNSSHLAQLSFKKFLQKEFADLAYSEPLYTKEFYFPLRNTSV
jgi:tRNA threonylcarbamoyladenosine biosynthesis protein TsaB